MSDTTFSDTTLTATSEEITEEQVAKYLQQNVNFFSTYPNLLAELELPHHSGQAVSLVEKQVSILRDRNIEMRQRLNHLLDNARDNDRLFDKSKRLVLALLETKDLASFVDALYYSFSKEFNIHYTRLIFFGNEATPSSAARVVNINEAREHLGKHLKSNKSVTGGIEIKEAEFLFDSDAPNIGSAALTVLSHGNLIGVLAIGNQDPSYYHSSMGTLFLGYIGEVLNRMLPAYLE